MCKLVAGLLTNKCKLFLGRDILYIGTGLLNLDSGYLYKSKDIGQTWQKINKGPTSMAGTSVMSLPIYDLAVDPRGKDTLHIAAGYDNEYAFVVSFDGGQSFVYLNSNGKKPNKAIAINQNFPDTVYFSSGNGIYLYDLANNNFRLVYSALPGEVVLDLVTGSILAGTTTGFYTIDQNFGNKTDTTIITKQWENTQEGFIVNVYPNPFEDEATLRLSLKDDSKVTIELFDLSGKKISNIYNGKCYQGSTNFNVSAKNLASGSYLISIKINDMGTRRLLYHVK